MTLDPDIVHASLYRPGVVGRAVARVCRKPVVTTLVNMTYEPEWLLDNPRLRSWKVWLTRAVDGFTARVWGTTFVAVTESVKASAVRQLGLPPERISVIPRGLTVDRNVARADDPDIVRARAAAGWADAYPLVLNVGRLVPQKGQRYAILAMRKVIARFPTARLVIAGEGRLRPALEELIRAEGLEHHVTLLGERQDVPMLLKMADLFLFPSLYEGTANALLEAMAAAKPCVATRIAPHRELTGDGAVALLAGLQSPEELAVDVLTLAQDRERARRLGEAAHDWVLTRYDNPTSVTALEALYQRIAVRAPVHIQEARV
jgi:glycosyltransferase involved in cell wall biosynthesis